MSLNPLNHHYSMENPASVYDEEAMTALELAGRTTAKVNETVQAFNELDTKTSNRLAGQDSRLTQMEEKQIPKAVTDEVQEHIDNGAFDTSIDNYAGELSKRVDNLLGQVVPGSTSGDAELVDGRTNELGQPHANIGKAIRRNATNIAKLRKTVVTGFNLVPPDSIVRGAFINQTTGAPATNANHSHTGYIEIEPGQHYTAEIFANGAIPTYAGSTVTKVGDFRVAFYTSDKVFISGEATPTEIIAPENAYYCRISYGSNSYNIQFHKGESVEKVYHHYTESINPDYAEPSASIMAETENIIGPAYLVDNTYVNQVSGVYTTGTENSVFHHCYKEIPVEPGTVYCVAKWIGSHKFLATIRVAFYDKMRRFLCGYVETETVTAPIEACYVSVSCEKVPAGKLCMCAGETQAEFKDFTGYIKPGFIDGYTRGEIDSMMADGKDLVLNLPDTLYALVGEELNIYFDNLVDGKDTDYTFDVTCVIGHHMENGYRLTPTTDQVGSHNITITAICNGVTLSKTAVIKVAPSGAGSGVTRSVLILGDSTTANGICVSKLVENFSSDTMSVSALGTQGTGNNKHEGRSGWTLAQYFTKDNPFYNPATNTFDASYYFNNSGVEKPDYFIINMGINDVFASIDGLETLLGRYDQVIESVQSASPTTKVCVALTIPPNYSQDPFGKAYSCDQTRAGYKRNNITLVEALIDRYQSWEGVYLIPIHTNLDTRHNMTQEETKYNKRNPATYLSPNSSGGVHPDTNGYWQIADVYWFFIKNMEV